MQRIFRLFYSAKNTWAQGDKRQIFLRFFSTVTVKIGAKLRKTMQTSHFQLQIRASVPP
jgi:hypothetical protein